MLTMLDVITKTLTKFGFFFNLREISNMADVTSHKNQEFEIEEVFSHTVESVLEMSYDCGTLVLRT